MVTPLYKPLKQNGTSFYAFPGAAEDISAQYQNENYRMYFSKYTLLNFPKEQTDLGGTNSSISYFDFGTFSSIGTPVGSIYGDRVIESLRNYVANHEISLRESRLNNSEYYYDTRALETTSEKIFWKWCKKLNLIDFDPAIPGDEYFDNLNEFQRVSLTDDSYFPEYLWKEREIKEWNISSYYFSTSTSFPNNLELLTQTVTNVRTNDVIELLDFNTGGDLPTEIFGSATWSTVTLRVLDVTLVGSQQKIICDFSTTSGSNILNTGKIRIKYNKLVQYIGDVNGISNVQEANRAYTEVYAHIPDHTGQTPDILFRIIADTNYKPGMIFPIIPSQYQPEIIGAELFSSPIVSNPNEYPGSYYGQFDTPDFTYECQSGDTLRRSGKYYGVSGDINDPVINGSTIDGLTIDFNTSHYVKMNIQDREISTFDQFNALEVNNTPPIDFEFNAILWYYTVEDLDGNRRTNLYGISFLDHPDNNPKTEEISIRFPVYKKLVSNGSQDGTSYAFGLNLNFNIIHDNPQEAYNPQAINSLFGMNLFNETMRRLSSLNESFINILGEQSDLQSEILGIKQLIYSQTDINTINSKISNIESLLKIYSTQQITSSDTVKVKILDTSPSQLQLHNIDTKYSTISKYLTSDMFNINGIIPINITPPENKDFLLHIENNDELDITIPNNNKLKLVISEDIYYKQNMGILITGTDISTQNKKLDIYVTTINPISITSSTPAIETLLIGDIDLPIFYNNVTLQPNSASTWKKFNFEIDFTNNIELISGNYLQFKLNANSLIVGNSIKKGDVLVLNNLFIGTASIFDFSGQYKVESVSGVDISLNVNNNSDFISYASNNYPITIHNPSLSTSILSNNPYLSLNKGYFIDITRISELDNVSLSDKYLIDVRDLQY